MSWEFMVDSSHVWVGVLTYVHLNRRFIYVALLMDVLTRRIRGWKLSQHLTQSLTLQPLQEALLENVNVDFWIRGV